MLALEEDDEAVRRGVTCSHSEPVSDMEAFVVFPEDVVAGVDAVCLRILVERRSGASHSSTSRPTPLRLGGCDNFADNEEGLEDDDGRLDSSESYSFLGLFDIVDTRGETVDLCNSSSVVR